MCRWRENLGQLTAEQQQAYLNRESQIRRTFAGTEHIPQAQAGLALSLDSAWIVATRPVEGVDGYRFDDRIGHWVRL